MLDKNKYIEWLADSYMLGLPKLHLVNENDDPIEDEAFRECVRRAFIAGAIMISSTWPVENEERIKELMEKYPGGIKK